MSGTRVFVYGTLLKGEHNEGLLSEAVFEGAARTRDAMTMVRVSGARPYDYPAVLLGPPSAVIEGEVYRVDAPTLDLLDRLEDYPRLYDRVPVVLEDGREAWIYVMHDWPGGEEIVSGSWRARPR